MEMRKSELIKDKQMAIEKLTNEHSSEVNKISEEHERVI